MKKILSLLIVAAMLIMTIPSSASVLNEEQITYLAENGIMVGDPNGDLRLSDTITRAEASKVLSVAFEISAEADEGFYDVDVSHWAYGYISSMKKSGIINGYPDGSFMPENNVTYAEFIKMTVEAMGHGEEAKADGGYPFGYIKQASTLGITSGIEFDAETSAIRDHIGAIIYNAKKLTELKNKNLYIMGDSLADTFPDSNYPLQGWGTFLGDYFKDEMTVHNRARNGWTTKRYLVEGQHADYPDKAYWDVIKEELKEGDWLLIGLGINDCSLTNKNKTTEEEYKENLTKFTNEAREKGVNVMFITQTIKGGDYDSELGWDYILPSDGIPMDDNVPMEQRWVRRAKVLTDIGAELNVPVIQFGKFLSGYYEVMYQEYMTSHPEASVKDGRNYVRTHFHIYNKNINDEVANGGFGLNLPDKADDSTHTNVRGSKEYASIIAKLIAKSDTELAKYVLEEDELPEKTLFIMGDSLADTFPNSNYPLQGWGTFIRDNVKTQLTVKNCARNGWTTKRYLVEGQHANYPDKAYWDVIKEELKEGDWLLIGLGINDCSLTNKNKTTEEEYKANLTKFTNEAREKGVNVMFITQTIKGGDYDSELGWDYILPSDGIPMDDTVPMEQRWVRRARVLTDIGAELNVPVIQFGKFLSGYYEAMYQEYMASHPEASVKDGRNYVRTHFHIYNKNINDTVANGGFGLNLPDKADDSTHTNIKGSREFAAIITNLISESNTDLAKYMSSLIKIY